MGYAEKLNNKSSWFKKRNPEFIDKTPVIIPKEEIKPGWFQKLILKWLTK